jgi:parallel beta-helix repeat protein
MKRLGTWCVIAYVVSTGTAQAANYFVSTTGNDGFSCGQAQSISSPKRSITSSLTCLAPGDTLFVRGGTYNEVIKDNVPSGTGWGNKVRIANYNGESVWLIPSAGDFAIYFGAANRQYIEFDGINIDGSATLAAITLDNREGENPNHIRFQNARVVFDGATGGGAAAINVGGTDHEFINLNVHGIAGPYGFYLSGDRALIDGCDIHHVASLAVHIYSSHGTPTGNIVRNNRIHDLTSSYFFGAADARIGGILVSGTANKIYNNVIYGINFPYQGGNAGISVYTGSGHEIYNNTIASNTTDGIVLGPAVSNAQVRNNIAYGNSGNPFVNGGSSTVESNNLFGVDPSFVNASANDFQLRNGSRAVDAGVRLSLVTTDIVGTGRPQGASSDIGAFEYNDGQGQFAVQPPQPPANVRIVSN